MYIEAWFLLSTATMGPKEVCVKPARSTEGSLVKLMKQYLNDGDAVMGEDEDDETGSGSKRRREAARKGGA